MIGLLILFFFLMMFTLIIVATTRSHTVYDDFDEEDEVVTITTTTTTTEPNYTIVGTLTRSYAKGQPFVIDPVDKDKVWLNTKDDLYEDGAGKIWELK